MSNMLIKVRKVKKTVQNSAFYTLYVFLVEKDDFIAGSSKIIDYPLLLNNLTK